MTRPEPERWREAAKLERATALVVARAARALEAGVGAAEEARRLLWAWSRHDTALRDALVRYGAARAIEAAGRADGRPAIRVRGSEGLGLDRGVALARTVRLWLAGRRRGR